MEDPGLFDLREALRHGEVSSHDLVGTALERAEASADLGAFVSLNGELALAEARAADARIAATVSATARRGLPPLLGLP
ncbi:amidase, partial [Leucobacter soli]